jgi:hypothetical protein
MTHSLLSVHSVEGEVREPMTDEELARSHQQLGILEQELKSALVLAASAVTASGRAHPSAAVQEATSRLDQRPVVRPCQSDIGATPRGRISRQRRNP